MPHAKAAENSYMLVKGPCPVRIALVAKKADRSKMLLSDTAIAVFSAALTSRAENARFDLAIQIAAISINIERNTLYSPAKNRMLSVFNLASFRLLRKPNFFQNDACLGFESRRFLSIDPNENPCGVFRCCRNLYSNTPVREIEDHAKTC